MSALYPVGLKGPSYTSLIRVGLPLIAAVKLRIPYYTRHKCLYIGRQLSKDPRCPIYILFNKVQDTLLYPLYKAHDALFISGYR